MSVGYLTPPEIVEYTIETGVKKVKRSFMQQFMLAFMAGVFVSLGAIASSTAIHDIANKGLSKTLAGVIFPVGLILVVIAGAELFTGNCLISVAVLDRKVKLMEMVKNLIVVYFGNMVGAVLFAWMESYSGMFDLSGGALGAYHIKTAAYKTSLPFGRALVLGIMCNVIVCLGVWVMYAAKDIAGKVLAGFFPIFAFVISGYEHSVANMYYIPAGIFAKANHLYVEASHLQAEALSTLTWRGFFINNLIPVTIGNIIGGSLFVGAMYWYIFKSDTQNKSAVHNTSKAA